MTLMESYATWIIQPYGDPRSSRSRRDRALSGGGCNNHSCQRESVEALCEEEQCSEERHEFKMWLSTLRRGFGEKDNGGSASILYNKGEGHTLHRPNFLHLITLSRDV